MKYSGKMYFGIKLKVTKTQGYTPTLENTIYEKPPRGGGRVQIDPPSLFRVKEQNGQTSHNRENWQIL